MRTRRPYCYIDYRVVALVGVLIAALSALAWPLPVHAAPVLNIEPPRGRCIVSSPPLTVRGMGFPPGLRVTIVDFGTADDQRAIGFPIGEGTVGVDGTFSVDGVRFRCPAELVEGQQHTIGALPADITHRTREEVLATVIFTTSAIPTALPPDEEQCFAEIGQCVAGRFLAYWRYNGGLARHGYPLTGERRERLEDGQEYLVQYFERTRLEYHPENAPPYDVLIGQLGRHFHPVDPPVAPLPRVGEDVTSEVRYFPETGHNLSRFRYYWTEQGGAEIFGLPISEEVVERLEDGNEYTVQYFERARLEWHPGTSTMIVVGQLGRRALAESASAASPIAAPADDPALYPTSAVGIPLTPEPGSKAPPPALPAVIPTTGPSPGQPALRPSNANAAPGLPALTEQDVRAQVLDLPDWRGTFPARGPVAVAKIEFITGQQVNARLNRPRSQPDDRPICFVTLTGDFNRTAHAPGLPGPTPTPVASSAIYLIFDATTGNLLAMGEGTK